MIIPIFTILFTLAGHSDATCLFINFLRVQQMLTHKNTCMVKYYQRVTIKRNRSGKTAGNTSYAHLFQDFNLVFNTFEPQHETSNNIHSLIRAFACRLNILWILSYWQKIIWSSKLKTRLCRLLWVCNCQNATLLESTCLGSFIGNKKQ